MSRTVAARRDAQKAKDERCHTVAARRDAQKAKDEL
jgi:hypothetical protein